MHWNATVNCSSWKNYYYFIFSLTTFAFYWNFINNLPEITDEICEQFEKKNNFLLVWPLNFGFKNKQSFFVRPSRAKKWIFLIFGLFFFCFFYNLTIKKDSKMSENTTSFEKKKQGIILIGEVITSSSDKTGKF